MPTTLTLTPVSGTVETPFGEAPAHGLLRLSLARADREGDTTIAPHTLDILLDATGSFSRAIWATQTGTEGQSYAASVEWWSDKEARKLTASLGFVSVPDSAGAQLADLWVLDAPDSVPADILAQSTAAAAAAVASANAAAADRVAAEAAMAAAIAGAASVTDQDFTEATFTGNGVTTAATLPGLFPTKKNFLVDIEGQSQHDSAFALSVGATSTTITFSEAIPNGCTARIRVAKRIVSPTATEDQITDLSGRTVADRAAALAWIAAAATPRQGFVLNWGEAAVRFVGFGVNVIPDMAGYVPHGDITPEIWKDNAVPGTTDMSAAIEAAANYGKTRLLAKTYQCNSPVEVYARNGASFIGDDREASVIRFGAGNDNWFTFYTRQTSSGVPLSCIGVKMRNLTLKTSDLGKTAGYLVYFEERGIGCVFEDIDVYGGFNQFRASALGLSFFTRCRFYTGGRTVAGGKMLHFHADETVGVWDPASPIQFAKPTDVHVTDCQFNLDSGELFEDAVAIDAADGLYFSNCHVRGATNCVAYEALAEPCRSVIASVNWSNCYFDNVNGSHVVYRGVGNGTLWTAPGVGGIESDVRYRDHKYTGCRFREAGNAGDGAASLGSFIADMTSGYVDWITVSGSTFRQNYRSGINAPTSGKGFRFLNVSGSTFVENNEANASSHGDIWVSGGGHNITGNTCIAGGANGNAIRVGGGTERSLVSGNNVEQSTTTTKISRGGSSVSIRGNVGYTLRAKGQVTITNPATTAVVTHGLSAAPESGDIILTLRGNPSPGTHAWVTAVGSTTFTINLNASPTASVVVDWQVNAERL